MRKLFIRIQEESCWWCCCCFDPFVLFHFSGVGNTIKMTRVYEREPTKFSKKLALVAHSTFKSVVRLQKLNEMKTN